MSNQLLMWLVEAGRLAERAAHPTIITLEGDAFWVRTHLHSKNPYASTFPSPSSEFTIALRDLAGLRASPFPQAIRMTNDCVTVLLERMRKAFPINADRAHGGDDTGDNSGELRGIQGNE